MKIIKGCRNRPGDSPRDPLSAQIQKVQTRNFVKLHNHYLPRDSPQGLVPVINTEDPLNGYVTTETVLDFRTVPKRVFRNA